MAKTVWIQDRVDGRRDVPGYTFSHVIGGQSFDFTWHKLSAMPTISHARSGLRVCDVQPEDRKDSKGWQAAARRAIDRATERNGTERVLSILARAPDLLAAGAA